MTSLDIKYLRRAIKLAVENGLLQEFKICYRSQEADRYPDGSPIAVYHKCWHALNEWDCLKYDQETNHLYF